MLQFGEDAYFPQESVGNAGEGKLRTEHLQGDVAVVPDVPGNPDPCHAALTQFPLEGVPVTEFHCDESRHRGWSRRPLPREG